MALVAADLRDAMIAALVPITGDGHTAQDALTLLANSINTYVMGNAVIAFAWNGILPPSTPENTTPNGEIESLNITLTPSLATTQSSGLSYLSAEIIVGVEAATYNITDGGYSTTPLPLSNAPTSGSLNIIINSQTTQQGAHMSLAQSIVDYITGLVPTAPVQGSHGSYTAPTGTGGTVTGIS